MHPPHPARNYEYQRAVKFLRLHFHSSTELGVIDEDSAYSFSFTKKKGMSRSMTISTCLDSLANDDDDDNWGAASSFLQASR